MRLRDHQQLQNDLSQTNIAEIYFLLHEIGSTDAHLKMVMAAASWNDVTPSTIQNCFRHAGFKPRNYEYETAVQQEQEEPTMQVSDQTLSGVSNLLKIFPDNTCKPSDICARLHQCG
ncbi:hypothetical protein PoB_005427900 [Plakobranchus ocellatus]|uniref:DDE-1 domain-containing protein n=1 Tax=Plakobranchus ocellatus TaxID=259542 RepID=A0AAV4C9M7_9GAST|nr:hypothetical protein PoB_005427900 [Plakobranchus ocellatus]